MKDLFPGASVSVSGIYRVVHNNHRADHEVLALADDVLPPCRLCKDKVRFHLERPIDYAPHDWDLAGPLFPKAVSE